MNPLTKLAAHLVSTILLAVGLVACDSARHPPRDCAAASTLRNVRETMSGEKPSIRLIKFSNSLLKIDERYILFPITYDNGSYQQAASSRPKTHLNVRAISLRMSLPDLAPPSQADEEARFQESKEIAGSPSCWMTVGIEQWGNGILAI